MRYGVAYVKQTEDGVRRAGAASGWRSSCTGGRKELGYEVKKVEPPAGAAPATG